MHVSVILSLFVPLFHAQYFLRRSKRLRGHILEDHCPKQRRLTTAVTAATRAAVEQAGCRCCGRGGGVQRETRCAVCSACSFSSVLLQKAWAILSYIGLCMALGVSLFSYRPSAPVAFLVAAQSPRQVGRTAVKRRNPAFYRPLRRNARIKLTLAARMQWRSAK